MPVSNRHMALTIYPGVWQMLKLTVTVINKGLNL